MPNNNNYTKLRTWFLIKYISVRYEKIRLILIRYLVIMPRSFKAVHGSLVFAFRFALYKSARTPQTAARTLSSTIRPAKPQFALSLRTHSRQKPCTNNIRFVSFSSWLAASTGAEKSEVHRRSSDRLRFRHFRRRTYAVMYLHIQTCTNISRKIIQT